mgnify:FL=1
MFAEITEQAFKAIVTTNTPITKVINKEHATTITYRVMGVECCTISNFLSCTTQYYIRDINS